MERASLVKTASRAGTTVVVALAVIQSPVRCAASVAHALPGARRTGGGASEILCMAAFSW